MHSLICIPCCINHGARHIYRVFDHSLLGMLSYAHEPSILARQPWCQTRDLSSSMFQNIETVCLATERRMGITNLSSKLCRREMVTFFLLSGQHRRLRNFVCRLCSYMFQQPAFDAHQRQRLSISHWCCEPQTLCLHFLLA